MFRKGSRVFSHMPWRTGMTVFLVIFLFFCADAAYSTDLPSYVSSITEKLTAPTAVALDRNGNVYVVDSSTNKLLKYDGRGEFISSFGSMDRPVSVAVDDAGRIFVGYAGKGSVEVYDSSFRLLFKLGAGDWEFTMPCGIAVDASGNAYVADGREDRVKVYNPDGTLKVSFGTSGSEDGRFHFPTSIALDRASREVFVSDLQIIQTKDGPAEGARIQVFGMEGAFRRSFGSYGQGEGKLTKPMSIGVDDAGKVYVTDAYQNVAQVFDRYGTYLGMVYDANYAMRTPMGLAVSGYGIFIASLNTGKVEMFGFQRKVQGLR